MNSETLDYHDGAVPLKGILVRDDAKAVRAGVVLFPDARGIGDHARDCAGRLAALGPDAGSAGVAALAYHPAAEKRSWDAMLGLFDEVFGASG
jgi:dienelactone hydrolase